jgi:hypothetical protein
MASMYRLEHSRGPAGFPFCSIPNEAAVRQRPPGLQGTELR